MNYFIISPEKSTSAEVVFWRPNNSGYTTCPFAAGTYTKEQIQENPNYYNNGLSSLAIPLTNEDLHQIGFKCSWDASKMPGFLQSKKQFAKHMPK